MFVGDDGLGVDETVEDLDSLAVVAERDGTLLSLANCFTTLEVMSEDEDKQTEILDDIVNDGPAPDCPLCEGEVYLLGTLGSVKQFRCRACGWTFSNQSQSGEPTDDQREATEAGAGYWRDRERIQSAQDERNPE
jgi:hypothetical protein